LWRIAPPTILLRNGSPGDGGYTLQGVRVGRKSYVVLERAPVPAESLPPGCTDHV